MWCCPRRQRREPLLPIQHAGASSRQSNVLELSGCSGGLSYDTKPRSVLEPARPSPSALPSTRPVRAAEPSFDAKPNQSFKSNPASFKSARNVESFREVALTFDEDAFKDTETGLPETTSTRADPSDEPQDADFHEFHDADESITFHAEQPAFSSGDPALLESNKALLEGLTKLERDILLPLKGRIEQEDGWELVSDSKGLECCRQRVDCTNPGRERPILMWKLRQTMQGATAKEVFDLVMDGPRTPTWHRHVSSWREINREHGATLIATCFKGVFPVSAREALEFRAVSEGAAEETGEYWIAFRSLGTLELDVPVAARHERTYTCMAGYRIRPGAEPGTAEFTFLAHTDPGGSLPDRVVEMAGPKGGTDYVVDLQKGLNARRKAG